MEKIRQMGKRRGSFDIQNYLITFLIVIGVLITFGNLAVDLSETYETQGGGQVSKDFADTYDNLEAVNEKVEDIEGKIKAADVGDEDAEAQFLGDVVNSLKILIPSLTIGTTMGQDMMEALGIGYPWTVILKMSLIIMIITTILFMIFKSRGT